MAVLGACFGALYWLLLPAALPADARRARRATLARTTTRASCEAALPRASGNFFAADLAEVRAARRAAAVGAPRRGAPRLARPARDLDRGARRARALGRRRAWSIPTASASSARPSEVAAAVHRPGRHARPRSRAATRSFGAIVAPLGTKIERVVLSARHAWQLRLANGLHLALGRDADLAESAPAPLRGGLPATREEQATSTSTCAIRTASRCACRT